MDFFKHRFWLSKSFFFFFFLIAEFSLIFRLLSYEFAWFGFGKVMEFYFALGADTLSINTVGKPQHLRDYMSGQWATYGQRAKMNPCKSLSLDENDMTSFIKIWWSWLCTVICYFPLQHRKDIVSIEELMNSISKLTKITDEAKLKNILHEMDVNEDGHIDIGEVIKVCLKKAAFCLTWFGLDLGVDLYPMSSSTCTLIAALCWSVTTVKIMRPQLEQFWFVNNSSRGYRGTFCMTVSMASRKCPARVSRTHG